jgi:ketopantoate reductase
MNKPVVLVGIGEMGGVFARGLLRLGHPVYPVTRDMTVGKLVQDISNPDAVVVAVGEKDLHPILKQIPGVWRDRLVLLQNELLPKDWQQHGLVNPTVISVWFEKKQGQDVKVLISSPVYGPKAILVKQALSTLNIPCRQVDCEEDLLFELMVKNLYILTVNIAGLVVGGNVHTLWNEHNVLARAIASEILTVQFCLAGKEFDRERLIAAMLEAFVGDPEHKCLGRSAHSRLQRLLQQAEDAGIKVSKLREIQQGLIGGLTGLSKGHIISPS